MKKSSRDRRKEKRAYKAALEFVLKREEEQTSKMEELKALIKTFDFEGKTFITIPDGKYSFTFMDVPELNDKPGIPKD